jgi:hypothetical protein
MIKRRVQDEGPDALAILRDRHASPRVTFELLFIAVVNTLKQTARK